MNLLNAYQQLKKLGPTFLTKEAATLLSVSANYAAIILMRLANEHAIVHLARGRWAYDNSVDPLLLPNVLSYPMMSYISLYSALYYHGMIDQIPSVVFAISNGKTKIFHTPLGTVSLHKIKSELFTGYETYGNHSLLMATPEKALFDTLYLFPTKSHGFKSLTELDISHDFNPAAFEPWFNLINNKGRRALIESKLKKTLTF